MISNEIYDMLAHQNDLIKYESSLKNRDKELDIDLNSIKYHENVKKGSQTYRDFLRIWEKSLMDTIAAMNVGADLFGLSTIHKTLKNKVVDKEDEIKELRLKISENRE